MGKILVTGGSGFLGLALVRRLCKQGKEVISFQRSFSEDLEKWKVEQVLGSIDKIEDFRFEGVSEIYHLAATTSMVGDPDFFRKVNIKGTESVLRLCKKNKIPFLVYCSTPSVVFGKDSMSGLNEDAPIPENHLSSYAHSKAIAERMVGAAHDPENLRTISLRPHLIWGPGDRHLLPTLVEKVKAGRLRIIGDGKNLVDTTYIENAVDAHLLAMEGLKENAEIGGSAYFIGDPGPVELWSFIHQLLKAKGIRQGLPQDRGRVPFKIAYGAGFLLEKIYQLFPEKKEESVPPMTRFVACQLAKDHYYSHERAERAFGYRPKWDRKQGLDTL